MTPCWAQLLQWLKFAANFTSLPFPTPFHAGKTNSATFTTLSKVTLSTEIHSQNPQFPSAFLSGKLADGSGGCMYVSGVPGTGKTATVTKVVELLRSSQEEGALPDFKLVQVNGMKLTTPQQIYVQIWSQLTGSKVSADAAVKLLHAKFSSNGPRHLPTVLIVDELDLLWTRQQDVLYKFAITKLYPLSTFLKNFIFATAYSSGRPGPRRSSPYWPLPTRWTFRSGCSSTKWRPAWDSPGSSSSLTKSNNCRL